MTCAEVDRLVDRFVDGGLEAKSAEELRDHAAGCRRCSRAIGRARLLARELAGAPPARAPQGFAAGVMNEVWRRELWSPAAPSPAAGRWADRVVAAPRAVLLAGRYRRLGLSFVLSAAVLSATLVVPQLAGRPGAPSAGASLVQGAIDGAGEAVRSALAAAGGPAAGILEGRTP